MRRIAMIFLALSISACTTDVAELLPQDGPTMIEIYNGHLRNVASGGSGNSDVLAAARRDATLRSGQSARKQDPLAYTRSAETEIDNLFPTLENPALVMHVFPHLATDERLPVPGYSTSFPLFERVEYALPGEIAEPRPSAKKKSRIRFLGGADGWTKP